MSSFVAVFALFLPPLRFCVLGWLSADVPAWGTKPGGEVSAWGKEVVGTNEGVYDVACGANGGTVVLAWGTGFATSVLVAWFVGGSKDVRGDIDG